MTGIPRFLGWSCGPTTRPKQYLLEFEARLYYLTIQIISTDPANQSFFTWVLGTNSTQCISAISAQDSFQVPSTCLHLPLLCSRSGSSLRTRRQRRQGHPPRSQQSLWVKDFSPRPRLQWCNLWNLWEEPHSSLETFFSFFHTHGSLLPILSAPNFPNSRTAQGANVHTIFKWSNPHHFCPLSALNLMTQSLQVLLTPSFHLLEHVQAQHKRFCPHLHKGQHPFRGTNGFQHFLAMFWCH